MEGIVFSGEEQTSLEEDAQGPEIKISNLVVKRPDRRGRPCSLSEEKLNELLKLYYGTTFSLRRIAGILGVSRMTVWRAVQLIEITI